MLSRQVNVISPVPAEMWEAVQLRDPHALPEHSPEWIRALCTARNYCDASRLYEFSDGSEFILPLVRRKGGAGAGGHLQSYPRSWGMGGVLGAGLEEIHAEAILRDLKALGMQRVSIHPDPTKWEPWSHAAASVEATIIPRRAHVVDLTGGAEAAFGRLRSTARRGVRKAKRSALRLETGNSLTLLDSFYKLLRLSVDRWAQQRNQSKPIARWLSRRRLPVEQLRAQRDHLGDRFLIVCAYLGDDPVSCTVNLMGPNGHETHGAMDKDRIGNTRAGDLVRWTAIKHACDLGATVHHLGESGESKALAFSKENYGARPYDYGEIVLEKLPWTRADRILRSSVKRVIGTTQAQ